MINNFVVYIYYRLDNGNPYYVGEGRPRRPFQNSKRNPWCTNITNKHGKRVEIVKSGLTKAEALELETFYIKKLIAEGYDLTNIIECSNSVYLEKRSNPKLAEWNKQHSGELSPTYGLKRPDLSERNKSGQFKRFVKPVKCKETGQEFTSVKEACTFHNRPNSSHITQHLSGKRKTAFGFTWELIC